MKFCTKCGNSLEDNANNCELCGELQPYTSPTPANNSDIAERSSSEVSENTYSQSYQQTTPVINTQPNYYNQQTYNTNNTYRKSNSSCIASFVLGLISIFIPNFITAVIGLIIGIVGVKNFKIDSETGKGLGVTGIVLNAISIFISVIITLVLIAVFMVASSEYGMYY